MHSFHSVTLHVRKCSPSNPPFPLCDAWVTTGLIFLNPFIFYSSSKHASRLHLYQRSLFHFSTSSVYIVTVIHPTTTAASRSERESRNTMCIIFLFHRCRANRNPAKFTTGAIPPMPTNTNENGEYMREKPWVSGGIRNGECLGEAELGVLNIR
ncbi:hypothetical protein K504DRAFT_180242 [Pleomassaria siparia CBS 279.74]|uniref:Uncharacterized protein n=1 Tax=Pleomassaria siparia CBS 279.74 TaxID=1314801 RepID=A0A6G1JTP2_9PLEO|nr:hypothetical protein K504DRAFT_180242 [Pleomassaria siparia CBS 279.74]